MTTKPEMKQKLRAIRAEANKAYGHYPLGKVKYEHYLLREVRKRETGAEPKALALLDRKINRLDKTLIRAFNAQRYQTRGMVFASPYYWPLGIQRSTAVGDFTI